MAAKGEGEAQFSRGCLLMSEAGGGQGILGAGGRSPKADVGLALCTSQFPPHISPRRVNVVT